MDLLASNNQCGQALVKLVARGNSIIAELLRLKDVIPALYRSPTRNDLQRYGELLQLDFTYFKQGNLEQEENYERKIEATASLATTDQELKDSFAGLLGRLYRLFDSVYAYVKDMISFIEDLESGSYIQVKSLETAFMNEDGKQMLCEMLYLYGCMLLLMDRYFEGPVREKLIVAHYRCTGAEPHIESICHLLRSTGFSPSGGSGKRQDGYPENFFARVPIPKRFVRMVIDRLRSDDIYNRMLCYQNPDHRSTALSGQSAMLYVVLYFDVKILQSDTAAMREIVDKFFPDNWVIAHYMGTPANLIDAWGPYKAAKLALNNTLGQTNVKTVTSRHKAELGALLPQISSVEKEGLLNETSVLDRSVAMLNLLKRCNVTLKWIMLHSAPLTGSTEGNKRCRQFRDAVVQELGRDVIKAKVFELLTTTAQLELRIRNMYKYVLDNRLSIWSDSKGEAKATFKQLSQIFGTETTARVTQSARLQEWFLALESQLDGLDLDDPGSSLGTAAQIIDALESAEDLDRLEANWHVKQLMSEAKSFLQQMVRVGAASDDVLVSLSVIGDLSYAWGEVIDTFTPLLQHGIKKDPSLVGKIRATFLKLSTAMEEPVLRISQARSRDLVSVSQYYSSELVSYVRKVLQVIPESLFEVLDDIISLQTEKLQDLPTRLFKDKLKDFAQLNVRFEVAKLTHSISVFTEGMLSLKSTLVGIIKVDPKQLLEDGIKKEMVRQVSLALHTGLIFSPKSNGSELVAKLSSLSKAMKGYRRSFEYISDYVGIAGLGLSVWHSEMARIFSFVVEQETNTLSKTKVLASDSSYQVESVPIPLEVLAPVPESPASLTFMSRLLNELLAITSPRQCVYIPSRATWYDPKTSSEVARISSLFPLLASAIGLRGLVGLDKLLTNQAHLKLLKHDFIFAADSVIFREKTWIDMLDNLADSLNSGNVIAHPSKFYHQQHVMRGSKPLTSLSDTLVLLGQVQLLRKSIAYHLALSSSYDSKLLHTSLRTLNEFVIGREREDLRKATDDQDDRPGNNTLLYELSKFLLMCGISDPDVEVYMDAKPGPRLPELLFLVIISTLSRLQFSLKAGELVSKRTNELLDGYPFILGTACLLQQYPNEVFETVAGYLTQYIQSFVMEQTSKGGFNALPEVANGITLLERLLEVRKCSGGVVERLLPRSLVSLRKL